MISITLIYIQYYDFTKTTAFEKYHSTVFPIIHYTAQAGGVIKLFKRSLVPADINMTNTWVLLFLLLLWTEILS